MVPVEAARQRVRDVEAWGDRCADDVPTGEAPSFGPTRSSGGPRSNHGSTVVLLTRSIALVGADVVTSYRDGGRYARDAGTEMEATADVASLDGSASYAGLPLLQQSH